MRQPRSVLHLMGAKWVEEPTQMILSWLSRCDSPVWATGTRSSWSLTRSNSSPFDYAVPVLTGWDMQYACEDHEIERIGVYVVEFEYHKDPNAPTGTLYYTIFSTMRDD